MFNLYLGVTCIRYIHMYVWQSVHIFFPCCITQGREPPPRTVIRTHLIWAGTLPHFEAIRKGWGNRQKAGGVGEGPTQTTEKGQHRAAAAPAPPQPATATPKPYSYRDDNRPRGRDILACLRQVSSHPPRPKRNFQMKLQPRGLRVNVRAT